MDWAKTTATWDEKHLSSVFGAYCTRGLTVGWYSRDLNNACRNIECYPLWRHQMEKNSALLAICAGNSPVPVNSPHKGQWRGDLMFSLICARNVWINNGGAGDLRRHRVYYDVIVKICCVANMIAYTPRLISLCIISGCWQQEYRRSHCHGNDIYTCLIMVQAYYRLFHESIRHSTVFVFLLLLLYFSFLSETYDSFTPFIQAYSLASTYGSSNANEVALKARSVFCPYHRQMRI